MVCHQCLSAWSFFSCTEILKGVYGDSSPVTSAFRRGASSADKEVYLVLTTATLSPVPFGVELLQLLTYKCLTFRNLRNVTSAFRRGASSAGFGTSETSRKPPESPVPFGVELLQLVLFNQRPTGSMSDRHQCLSAWSFFSCRGIRRNLRK